MPVFDFTNAPEDKKQAECTYETFRSNEKVPTADKPILLLENKKTPMEAPFLRRIYESKQAYRL